jgi:hypothetical protein
VFWSFHTHLVRSRHINVVRAVFCTSTQEIERLREAKSDEAFDLKLNLVRGFLTLHHTLLILLGM